MNEGSKPVVIERTCLQRVSFKGRRNLLERLGVKVFLNGRDNFEIQTQFDRKTNTFVDEPIPFLYRDEGALGDAGKEQEDDGKKTLLQDHRRADGFGRGPSRR